MVLYNTFSLVARIAEIATKISEADVSRWTRWRIPMRARRYASDTRYVIGPLYLIHALRAVIWISLKACVKCVILPVKACIQHVKCSAWWGKNEVYA